MFSLWNIERCCHEMQSSSFNRVNDSRTGSSIRAKRHAWQRTQTTLVCHSSCVLYRRTQRAAQPLQKWGGMLTYLFLFSNYINQMFFFCLPGCSFIRSVPFLLIRTSQRAVLHCLTHEFTPIVVVATRTELQRSFSCSMHAGRPEVVTLNICYWPVLFRATHILQEKTHACGVLKRQFPGSCFPR